MNITTTEESNSIKTELFRGTAIPESSFALYLNGNFLKDFNKISLKKTVIPDFHNR